MKTHGSLQSLPTAAPASQSPTEQQSQGESPMDGPEELDAEKIARLQEAIRSGKFVVDAARIMAAMMQEEL